MTSDAQKRARNKWNKENMTVQVCNITKTKKQAFKEACTRAGTTPNAVLVAAINNFIKENSPEE